jgi:RNA polymerase sigma-70 factor (ECF subfamily)
LDSQRERQLIQAAQRGNEQAFGELYDAYVDRIYRYFVYRIHDPEIARELTSEVFMRMVRDLRSFELKGVTLLAWLYRIAHARAVDY